MTTKLSDLSDQALFDHYAALRRQLADITGQIDALTPEVSARAGLLIVNLMEQANLTPDDLVPRKRRSVARFADPGSGQSWNGQGHMPRWLKGRDIEQFRLQDPDKVNEVPRAAGA